MERHTIRLMGPRTRGPRVPGSLLEDLLAVLGDAARGAVRLRLEGRSKARGGRPAWLDRAASFDLVGFSESLTRVEIEARPRLEAIPDELERLDCRHEVAGSKSAIRLLEESLAAALRGQDDSD